MCRTIHLSSSSKQFCCGSVGGTSERFADAREKLFEFLQIIADRAGVAQFVPSPRLCHHRGNTVFMDIQSQIEFPFFGVFAGSSCHKLQGFRDPWVSPIGAALLLQGE